MHRFYNPVFVLFFGLAALGALATGGALHHILVVLDLVLVAFGLYQMGIIPNTLIDFDLGFLKGSAYLTLVGLYASMLTLTNLFADGLLHLIFALIGAAVTGYTLRTAYEAYQTENAPVPVPVQTPAPTDTPQN